MQPIRDLDVLEEFKRQLKAWDWRNWMMFVFGINTGLRVSDILPLKVRDVEKDYVNLREKKTRKTRRILINDELRADLNSYLDYFDWLTPDSYLFESQKGGRPISTVQAYRILRLVADVMGLESIGTHTMRKTFGYHFYKRTKDIATLQTILNHSSARVTMRYIGIVQDTIDGYMKDFKL
ncbi:site-specific integrase [Paenibacillus odorifer]|uniref:site-specific integrase n=1 Tax=Paenibacillus odorifer TaxID=189426 RepID=UPI00096FF6E0|nr:site-specific integrase [Paenibacillus odorifer]OMD76680.1 site-specific integrase [Paenibacillus odorifer]